MVAADVFLKKSARCNAVRPHCHSDDAHACMTAATATDYENAGSSHDVCAVGRLGTRSRARTLASAAAAAAEKKQTQAAHPFCGTGLTSLMRCAKVGVVQERFLAWRSLLLLLPAQCCCCFCAGVGAAVVDFGPIWRRRPCAGFKALRSAVASAVAWWSRRGPGAATGSWR